jgi:SSS family transporter
MQTTDWVILVVYLGGVLLLGAWFALRRGEGEFFLAGRSMHWLPVGLSIMATAFSAMNYVAFSGEVAHNGLYVALSLPVFVIVAWPVTRIFMPFYHSLRLCSAYEYLERRFDVRVRCLASGLFLLWRVAWVSVALYVPARILSRIIGLPLVHVVVVTGVVATTYTVLGGMRAVMWTDVLQFFVLLGGIIVGVSVAAGRDPGGFGGLLQSGLSEGLARPFYPFDPAVLSPSPHVRISLWSALIGTFVAFVARYGADQVVVQRYFSARSLLDAQRGFRLNYAAAVVALVLLALLGFAIRAHVVAMGLPAAKPAVHFAEFVASLPTGVCGLVLAGLLAAAMSSVDSGVNSCAAALATDFYARFSAKGEGENVWRNRVFVLILGAVATTLACFVGRLGSLFDIGNRIVNALGSPLLAVILLGMFARRANARGVLVGGILGAAWSVLVTVLVRGISLHYYAVVNLIGALVLGYGASLLFGWLGASDTCAQGEWTWWEWRRRAKAGQSPET